MTALLDRRTLARLERLVALARRAPPSRPRRRALRRTGRGIEPGSRREYAPGDDVRLVDWPAYARLERLLVKVVEELPEPRLELLLDGSGSMARGRPEPAERAALAAAALAASALARDVAVTVWWGGAGPARLQLRRPGQLVALLRFLAGLRPGGPGRLAETADRAARLSRGRGGAILLSDGLSADDVSGAASRLAARGFAPLVVGVDVEQELPPPAAEAAVEAGLAELVDAETERTRAQSFAPPALAGAARARRERRRALASALEAAGVPLEVLSPGAPFEEVAQALLGRDRPAGRSG